MIKKESKESLDTQLKEIRDFVLKLRRGKCRLSSEVRRDKGNTLLVVSTDVLSNE